MKLMKPFWIGIAAAAALAMACGGNSDGPNEREQLTTDLAQFGFWEVLVEGYHDRGVITQRSVFRDVLILDGLDKGLYDTYLRAWARGHELSMTEGTDAGQLGQARDEFNRALSAVRAAASNPGDLDRSRLLAALRSAMETDRETIGLNHQGEVPNPGFWGSNYGEGWEHIWDATVQLNDAGLTGSAISAPIANLIDTLWWFRPAYMFDQDWVDNLHEWISAGIQVFLNSFVDEITLTQYAIDRQTASIEEGVAFIRDRRIHRDGSISIRFHANAGNSGATGSQLLPAASLANGASDWHDLDIPNWTDATDNRIPRNATIVVEAHTVNISGDIEWVLVNHFDPAIARVLTGNEFDELGWPIDESIKLQSYSNSAAVIVVDQAAPIGKIYLRARYVMPAPLPIVWSPQILEINLEEVQALVGTIGGRRIIGHGVTDPSGIQNTAEYEIVIPPTLSLNPADPVRREFNFIGYNLPIGRAPNTTVTPNIPAPTHTMTWEFIPADNSLTNVQGLGIAGGALTVQAPGLPSASTIPLTDLVNTDATLAGNQLTTDSLAHLVVMPGATPGRFVITLTFDDSDPLATEHGNYNQTLVLTVNIVETPGQTFAQVGTVSTALQTGTAAGANDRSVTIRATIGGTWDTEPTSVSWTVAGGATLVTVADLDVATTTAVPHDVVLTIPNTAPDGTIVVTATAGGVPSNIIITVGAVPGFTSFVAEVGGTPVTAAINLNGASVTVDLTAVANAALGAATGYAVNNLVFTVDGGTGPLATLNGPITTGGLGLVRTLLIPTDGAIPATAGAGIELTITITHPTPSIALDGVSNVITVTVYDSTN